MGERFILEPVDRASDPFLCDEPELLVGRGVEPRPGVATLDIDPSFGTVSREHARLRREKGAVTLENLGKHGSFVNGKAVEGRRALAEGDVIQFGRNGPRYAIRLGTAAPAVGSEPAMKRCPACMEILPLAAYERHERDCEVLHPRRGARKPDPAPSVFSFGTLRSSKRNLLMVVDLSGGEGSELSIVAPALVEALQKPPKGAGFRFNVMDFGGELWRGPAGTLHAATHENRAEARAWIRGRSAPGEKPSIAEALSRAFEFEEAEAFVLVVAGETEGSPLTAARGREIHAVGVGPLYAADSRTRSALKDLALRNGGGFFSIAVRA